jgi:hypothetical protein
MPDNMSRPWSSVPSRKSGIGKLHPDRRNAGVQDGDRGQIERIVRRDPGRKESQKKQDQRPIAATTVTFERRKEWNMSLSTDPCDKAGSRGFRS